MTKGAEKEKVIAKLRERQADATETAAADAVDYAETYFLAETHRSVVPVLAFWLWVELAEAFLRKDTAGSDQQIASIKRGDTTVQYQDGGSRAVGTFSERLAAYRVGVLR